MTTNRETWLHHLATTLEARARAVAGERHIRLPAPRALRIGVGFPLGTRAAKIAGQAWSHVASGDGVHEIIISPTVAEPREVAYVLAHEVLHHIAGIEAGHKGAWAAMARYLGIAVKWNRDQGVPAPFLAWARDIINGHLRAHGAYPHAALTADMVAGRKKQGTRMIKAECPECGYAVRLTRKWLAVATPHCPVHDVEMIADGADGADQ